MSIIHVWKRVLGRIYTSTRFQLNPSRSFCSSNSKKPRTVDNGGSSSGGNGSSISSYDEQYKALQNLDFVTSAKILFSEPRRKKKFGLDFHLVQLFFACLPSLAVYLLAQYARSEMRRMDAELEKKKQAEFEAHAKEMERKAAEEKAAIESNPQLLEVKERLDKLEERMKDIVVESKKQPNSSATMGPVEKKSIHVQPDNIKDDSSVKASKGGTDSTDGKASGSESVIRPSQNNQKNHKNEGPPRK